MYRSLAFIIATCWFATLSFAATEASAPIESAPADIHIPDDLKINDADWKLNLDKYGVKVYTRKYRDSQIKAFKAITEFDAPIDSVVAAMGEPDSCEDWVEGCIEAFGFDDATFTRRFAYSANDMPWPAQDRDYVLAINTWKENETGRIIVEMHAVEGKQPKKEKYKRVNTAQTIYVFEALDNNRTLLVWLQHVEPGGSLPGWLVNSMLTDVPYKSLRRLAKLVTSKQYQGVKLLTNDQGEFTGYKKP